jgi:hypothetical protein
VSVYLDASVLVALFTNDPLTARADTFLRANPSVVIVPLPGNRLILGYDRRAVDLGLQRVTALH